MSPWITTLLDIVLIALVGAGLVQASRLLTQLSSLRQGRLEMERFVADFSSAILRAENGVKDLRQAARRSGDDLERLTEKAQSLKDELMFIIESADQLASRLTNSVSGNAGHPAANSAMAAKPSLKAPEPTSQKTVNGSHGMTNSAASTASEAVPPPGTKLAQQASSPASRAEQELMKALQKLG